MFFASPRRSFFSRSRDENSVSLFSHRNYVIFENLRKTADRKVQNKQHQLFNQVKKLGSRLSGNFPLSTIWAPRLENSPSLEMSLPTVSVSMHTDGGLKVVSAI